jgi:hypothetical protein
LTIKKIIMSNTKPQVIQPKNKIVAEKPASAQKTVKKLEDSFVFGKRNYQVMVVGLVVIAFGFFLMYGREDVFNTMKITVAPIVVLLGFAIEVVAIMIKSETPDEHS